MRGDGVAAGFFFSPAMLPPDAHSTVPTTPSASNHRATLLRHLIPSPFSLMRRLLSEARTAERAAGFIPAVGPVGINPAARLPFSVLLLRIRAAPHLNSPVGTGCASFGGVIPRPRARIAATASGLTRSSRAPARTPGP